MVGDTKQTNARKHNTNFPSFPARFCGRLPGWLSFPSARESRGVSRTSWTGIRMSCFCQYRSRRKWAYWQRRRLLWTWLTVWRQEMRLWRVMWSRDCSRRGVFGVWPSGAGRTNRRSFSCYSVGVLSLYNKPSWILCRVEKILCIDCVRSKWENKKKEWREDVDLIYIGGILFTWRLQNSK